jgi:hypothetical protein
VARATAVGLACDAGGGNGVPDEEMMGTPVTAA